ncbi:uncharacterized protein [Argopecten irradians]|uniref:uncharacterized protein n=1 Tax=Argopecten irradians TaxID=31199 RepID=UPI003710D9F8
MGNCLFHRHKRQRCETEGEDVPSSPLQPRMADWSSEHLMIDLEESCWVGNASRSSPEPLDDCEFFSLASSPEPPMPPPLDLDEESSGKCLPLPPPQSPPVPPVPSRTHQGRSSMTRDSPPRAPRLIRTADCSRHVQFGSRRPEISWPSEDLGSSFEIYEERTSVIPLTEISLSRQSDDDRDVKSIVDIVKKGDIEAFNAIEGELLGSRKASILHIVAVYGSTEMVECLTKWHGIEWDAECKISEPVFGEDLAGLGVLRATALYLATYLDRTEMVCSLIKLSSEDNTTNCFRTLPLSDGIEKVFMLDKAEKLKSKHSDIDPTAVIPGHRAETYGKHTRVFVVYSKNITNFSDYELDGIGIVMIRNPYIYTKERKCNSTDSKTVSAKDATRAEKAISIYQEKLWAEHSNLNIISVSPVKYRNDEEDIMDIPCISLYCSTKGVVPLGEPQFPTRLDIGDGEYMDVDVHEGYFIRGGYNSLPSVNFHQKLKMGCNIGRSTLEKDIHGNPLPFIAGTQGPFVKFQNSIGFLTCAHVLFAIPPTTPCLDYQRNASNVVDIVQPSVDSTNYVGFPCGQVHRAIFNPQLDPSVDVAVVELTDPARIPTKGQFANASHNSYKEAGFEELPEYNSGYIRTDLKYLGTNHIVFKFGSTSDVTKGTLEVCGINVRPLTTPLGLPRGTGRIEMKSQYGVRGTQAPMSFFGGGDSGSAVFMKSDTGDLVLIGMAVGNAYVGTNPFPVAIVTPIGAILQILNNSINNQCSYSIASFP